MLINWTDEQDDWPVIYDVITEQHASRLCFSSKTGHNHYNVTFSFSLTNLLDSSLSLHAEVLLIAWNESNGLVLAI